MFLDLFNAPLHMCNCPIICCAILEPFAGETVAIKKVLQDRRFKNRELQIMSHLSHPCVIGLKHCFYS